MFCYDLPVLRHDIQCHPDSCICSPQSHMNVGNLQQRLTLVTRLSMASCCNSSGMHSASRSADSLDPLQCALHSPCWYTTPNACVAQHPNYTQHALCLCWWPAIKTVDLDLSVSNRRYKYCSAACKSAVLFDMHHMTVIQPLRCISLYRAASHDPA